MMTVQVNMTPEYASELLSRNKANRPVRKHRVLVFARAIERGEWAMTHQGIAIDVDGNLIDGQHRLLAVIKANTAVLMAMTTGMPRESYAYLDQGVSRKPKDHFGDAFIALSLNYIARMVTATRPTLAEMDKLYTCLKPVYDSLGDRYQIPKSKVSRAPIQAAFVVSAIKHPAQAAHLGQVYCAFASMDTQSPLLTPKLHSLLRQVITYKLDQRQIFAKAMRALENDPATSDMLVVKPGATDVDDAKAIIQSYLASRRLQR